MGIIFEELLRKFSEMYNETSGENYTPRDIVRLLVSFVFEKDREKLQGVGNVRSVYDTCFGTRTIPLKSSLMISDKVKRLNNQSVSK